MELPRIKIKRNCHEYPASRHGAAGLSGAMNPDELALALRDNLTLHWTEKRLARATSLSKLSVTVNCSAPALHCVMLQQLNSNEPSQIKLLHSFANTNKATL